MNDVVVTAIALAGLLGGSVRAFADHHHADMESRAGSANQFQAGVSLVAAQYDSMYYVGDYEGVVSSVAYRRGRASVMVSLPMYSLQANGLRRSGLGDVMAMGRATLLGDDRLHAGISLGVMAPTGDDIGGLGMGHVMAMSSVFAGWRSGRLAAGTSLGFARALASVDHVHGMWPLVEPMNMSELMMSGYGALAFGDHVETAIHLSGGIPVGLEGVGRLFGGLRAAWNHDRVSTGLDVETGLVGDPFQVRAIVDTTVRF